MRLNGTGVCACPANGYFDGFILSDTSSWDCARCVSPKCATCLTSSSVCGTCNGLYRDPSNGCACVNGPLAGINLAAFTNLSCLPCNGIPGCSCLLEFIDGYVASYSTTWNC